MTGICVTKAFLHEDILLSIILLVRLTMMALSTAPIPMKGRQFAKAIEKFEGWGSCSAVFVVSMTLSALNAASNSALQAS